MRDTSYQCTFCEEKIEGDRNMNIPVPNFIETKDIFSQGCGCGNYRNDNIRRDCYRYHCERQMGASIDCCTPEDSLGDCPCSRDCKTYISKEEVTTMALDYIEKRKEGD